MKDKTKTKIKFATLSSPAIAAIMLFPTETFSFLKMMKEAGFDSGTIAIISMIAWWLRKDVIRIVDGRLGDINLSVQQVGEDLKESNNQNAKQFEDGAKEMKTLAQHIRFIMTHLQISAPEYRDPDRRVDS